MEHLESNRALMSQILREENRGHAPTPKLALDVVAIGQSGPKAIDGSFSQSGKSERNSNRLALGLGANQWHEDRACDWVWVAHRAYLCVNPCDKRHHRWSARSSGESVNQGLSALVGGGG